jgi:hypothetical protein
MTATVKYQIGTYAGTVQVNYNPEDDDDIIIARAKRILRNRAGSFPAEIYYESWRVTSRDIDF